jgi:hypothetical protein
LSAAELQDFLSRPSNWPRIIATSSNVESNNSDAFMPLKQGMTIKEYFVVGISNALSVTWTCQTLKPGVFVVESLEGLAGIANQCQIRFDMKDGQVDLIVEYNTVSPLAILAASVLFIDNWIALNVILPTVAKKM